MLPGEQQLKFTAALARREVTVWASDRSIHIVLDARFAEVRTVAQAQGFKVIAATRR